MARIDRYENIYKYQTRECGFNVYTDITGNTTIPAAERYLSLVDKISFGPYSELKQMKKLGLLPGQFVGVNNSAAIIAENHFLHGKHAKFICGEWNRVLSRHRINAGLVSLDTVSGPKAAATMLATTINRCRRAVILCNVALTNAHNGAASDDAELLTYLLPQLAPDCEFRYAKLADFAYKANRTEMRTYVFAPLSVIRTGMVDAFQPLTAHTLRSAVTA